MDDFPRIYDDGYWDSGPEDDGVPVVLDEAAVDADEAGGVTLADEATWSIECGASLWPAPSESIAVGMATVGWSRDVPLNLA